MDRISELMLDRMAVIRSELLARVKELEALQRRTEEALRETEKRLIEARAQIVLLEGLLDG